MSTASRLRVCLRPGRVVRSARRCSDSEMALMLAGAHVRSASNAEEALELLRASVPAVIITDIRMPGHNGLWLLDQVRALPLSSAVPVIAYTGDVSLSD